MPLNKIKKENNFRTDWGQVASWYDNLIKDNDSYQAQVILPNMLRLLGFDTNKKLQHKNILDIACGAGYFDNIFVSMEANVYAVDLGNDLIKIAKDNYDNLFANNIDKNKIGIAKYFVGNAESFTNITDLNNILTKKDFCLDYIICTLAIQNIQDIDALMQQIKKVVQKNTKILFVINHPSFRIPQHSDWHFDINKNTQSRLISKYMSQVKIQMDMNPGQKLKNKKIYTYSFHRPLQYYIKVFNKNGFVITGLEEWISHKVSENGAKKKISEDVARKEIPMFMMLQLEIK